MDARKGEAIMKFEISIDEREVEKSILQNRAIREDVANRLYSRFIDLSWSEIKGEFTEIARDVVRKVVAEYVKEYYEERNIERDVREVMAKLTKDEIIEILKGKI